MRVATGLFRRCASGAGIAWRVPPSSSGTAASWHRLSLGPGVAASASSSGLRRLASKSVEGAASAAESAEVDLERQRRVEEFRRVLRQPDDIFVRSSEARKLFRLSRQDLEELGKNFIVKENPYDEGRPLKQYSLKEVVALALSKHSEEELLKNVSLKVYSKDLSSDKIYGHFVEDDEEESAKKITGTTLQFRKMYWYNAPSTTTVEGRKSVMQGLKVNLGICTAKGIVWVGTGSHAIFADLMHSIADVLNYSYRLMELNRSSRQRDLQHPYGYAPLRYITADRTFVYLGFVGGICPLLMGAMELSQIRTGAIALGDHLVAPAAVFIISALLESMAVRTAYREILSLHAKELSDKSDADGKPAGGMREVFQYLREGRDVMSTATITEASTGVLASLTGLVGLGASYYLASGAPDVIASMVMAGMVCGVSAFLLRKSGESLLGQTLPRQRVKDLVLQMEAHPAVVNVFDVKTEMIGTDTVRFKAEVQFNPQTITKRVLQAAMLQQQPPLSDINEHDASNHLLLAARLREALPQLKQGIANDTDAAVWLYRNNGLFYEALAWELRSVEKLVRSGLVEFKNVHIDLEPW